MALQSFVLPLPVIGILACGWLAALGLLWFIMDLRYYGKEGFDFRKCRKDNVPYMIDVDIGSGAGHGYAGEKAKKGIGRILHKSDEGAKIDTSITMGQDEPIRLPRGLEIQIHGTLDGWPTSLRNMAGIAKIKEIRREKEFAALDSIPDKDIIELLDTPDDHLVHDSKLFIEKYKIPNPEADPAQIRAVNAKLDAIIKDPKNRIVGWLRRDDLITLLLADDSEVVPLIELMVMKYYQSTGDMPEQFPAAVMAKLDDIRQDPNIGNIISPIIPAEKMMEMIGVLKERATKAVIDPRFGALRSALKDNPNAFKTSDISMLESILRQIITDDLLKKFNLGMVTIFVVAIIMAGSIGFAIVYSTALK